MPASTGKCASLSTVWCEPPSCSLFPNNCRGCLRHSEHVEVYHKSSLWGDSVESSLPRRNVSRLNQMIINYCLHSVLSCVVLSVLLENVGCA